MKKILITGATGFIGKNLKEQLSSSYTIIAPTHKQLNLLDDQKVKKYLEKEKFDIVIHCATHNATVTSTKDVNKVLDSNLRMFFNLARCNTLYNKMFYFGSGAEYDKDHYTPKMPEEYFGSFVPKDAYGFSKYIMAKYAQNKNNIIDLRLFGCFGKYEDWRIRFISSSCCRAIFNQDITIRQNIFIDYLYVDDLARIMEQFIDKKMLEFSTYNVCTGIPVDLQTLAKLVIKVSGKKLSIKTAKEGFQKEYSGNNYRLTQEFGTISFTPLENAIHELYQWYDDNKKSLDQSLLMA